MNLSSQMEVVHFSSFAVSLHFYLCSFVLPLILPCLSVSFVLFSFSSSLLLSLFLPCPSSFSSSWADFADVGIGGCSNRQGRLSGSTSHRQSNLSPSLQVAFLIPHASPLTHLGISSGSHLLPLPLHPSFLQQAEWGHKPQNNGGRVRNDWEREAKRSCGATWGFGCGCSL